MIDFNAIRESAQVPEGAAYTPEQVAKMLAVAHGQGCHEGAHTFKDYWRERIKKDRGMTAVGTNRWNWLDALADHIELFDPGAIVDEALAAYKKGRNNETPDD